jgi:hypothetical protein
VTVVGLSLPRSPPPDTGAEIQGSAMGARLRGDVLLAPSIESG